MVSFKVQGLSAILAIAVLAVGIWAIAGHFDLLPEELEGAIDSEAFEEEKIKEAFGTAVQLNVKMPNMFTGANIGDGTNDHVYIIEILGGDWQNPANWEPEGLWEDILPDADGTLSGEYRTGQDLILYAAPQTENKALYHMTAPAPVSPNDNQITILVPVATPTSSDTDIYMTDTGTVVSASVNMDYSTEGSDGAVDVTCTITAATADAANFYTYVDPALAAGQQKVYGPYIYIRANVSAVYLTSPHSAVTHDGTYWYHWISMADAGIPLVQPKGVPQYLEMVPGLGGQSALLNDAGDPSDGRMVPTISFEGIAADQELIFGFEYCAWEGAFAKGTPSGDVTETIKVQA